MKLRYIFVAISLGVLALIGGCQGLSAKPDSSPPTAYGKQPAEYTDDLGRKVLLPGVPQRIISLSPSNTELVYALGLDDKLIGVTTYCNYPPQVKDKPKVSEYSQVDIEKVVSLKPDLILADNIHKADVIPALEKLGLKVIEFDPPDLARVMGDLEMLGRIGGKTQEALSLIASLQGRIKAVTDKTDKLASSEKARAFFLTWHDPLWTAGSGTMINELIDRAGGNNIAGDLGGHSQIDLETVIQRNPQVIFVMTSMGDQDTSFNYIKTEPRFQSTDAVKNGRVYRVDSDIFGRTTPRCIDGLEQMSRLMHPATFK